MPRRFWFVALTLAAILQAALFVLDWPGRAELGDEGIYLEAADRVRASGQSGIEPLWPPLYPWFLAGVRAWSTHPAAHALVQIGLLGLAVALLYRAAIASGAAPAVAAIAAFWLMLDPALGAFAHYHWPEILHLALLAALVYCLAVPRSLVSAAWCGALAGLLVLAKSLLLLLLPLVLVVLARRSTRRSPARLALALAAFGVVLAPALVASYRSHGPMTLGGSATFNLWLGLQPGAPDAAGEFRAWRESAPEAAGRERVLRRKLRELVRARGPGELLSQQLGRQYRRLFDRSSFLTIQLPGGEVHSRGAGYRGANPAVATRGRGWHDVILLALLVLVPFGCAVALCTRPRWALPALIYLGYQLALFLPLYVTTRYRIAMMPAAALLAAAAVVELRDRAIDWRRPGRLGLLLVALAAAGVLVWSSFW